MSVKYVRIRWLGAPLRFSFLFASEVLAGLGCRAELVWALGFGLGTRHV